MPRWLIGRFHVKCIDAESTMRQYATRLRASLAASLMLVTLAGAVVAGPLDDASHAIEHGDYATALQLLRQLASKDVAEAQHELGFMYYNGIGVPQDYEEAVKWYSLAADHDIADAQHDLGVMYLHGQGVPQNYVLAHMWFNLAASRIPASKKIALESAIKDRDLVASKMTPEQIAEAQKLAHDWNSKPQR